MPFEWIAVKCDPDLAIELREKYTEITPAYHFNKKHWNGINMHGTLPVSYTHLDVYKRQDHKQ